MEKFPSLKIFYTHAVTGVTDNYQVCPSLLPTSRMTQEFCWYHLWQEVWWHRMGALTLPRSLSSSLSSALSWAHEVTSGAAPRRSRCPQLVLLSCSRLGCQLLHTSLKITNAFLSHLCIFSPHIFYICFPSFAYFFQASILDPSTSSPLLLIPLSLLLPVLLLLALAPLLWQAEHPRVEKPDKVHIKQTNIIVLQE